jgi:CRISPR-associated endoribonuclease Cas6
VPTTFRISASLPKPISSKIGFKDLHRLACFLMEESGDEAHDQQVKSFSIWPLLVDEEDDRQVDITIHSLVDNPLLEDQLRARLAGHHGKKANLGPDLPIQNTSVEITVMPWETLSMSAPKSSVNVELLSPMFYSRSGVSYPLPDPILVHRQLALRWSEFAPEARMQISDEISRELNSQVAIQNVELSSVNLPELQHKVACTGQFSFTLKKSAETIHREWFSSLWQFAEFCGLGAMTTQGLGAVSIHLD